MQACVLLIPLTGVVIYHHCMNTQNACLRKADANGTACDADSRRREQVYYLKNQYFYTGRGLNKGT